MKNFAHIASIVFLAGFALLQIPLALVAMGQSVWVGVIFLLAGLLLGAGLVLRRSLVLLAGAVASLVGPLAVGLTGIEPFELIHHIVRLLVVGALVLVWMLTRRAPSARSAGEAS